MQNVTFTLPTVPSAGMTRDEQGALIVNQATAVIVSKWLEHANLLVQTYSDTTGQTNRSWLEVDETKLANVITTVQNALRSF